ncbi:MAG: hypothetical protein J5747_09560 [Spirochaetaceae bacterium]|nr:hypothetical protein [Spirochaetaceae bacterium]
MSSLLNWFCIQNQPVTAVIHDRTYYKHMKRIIMLCLSAGIQKTISFECLTPGEVNRSKSYQYDASGKAINSARVLMQLVQLSCASGAGSVESAAANSHAAGKDSSVAASVSVVCPLGERNKDFFLEMANNDGLNVKVVPIPGFTRECCTLIDTKSGQTTELVVEEPVLECDSAPYEEKLMNLLLAELGLDDGEKADALLFSGSRPKFWSAGIIKRIAAAAKENGILFMADFRGNDLLSILDEYTPDIIKINEDEFWATFSTTSPATTGNGNTNSASTPQTEEQLSRAITETSRRLNNIVVVTRGSKPTLAAEKGTPYNSPSECVKAVNTIGCGDAYNAGFLYEYLATKDMEKSLEKGKWCASRNAESLRPGVLHD